MGSFSYTIKDWVKVKNVLKKAEFYRDTRLL